MTFNIDGFVTVENFVGAVGGVAIQEHRYATNDTKNTIEVAGYFNGARDEGLLKQGDLLFVAGDRDGTPFMSGYIFDTVPTSGNVTITEMAAITQNVQNVLTADNVDLVGANAAQVRFVMPFAGTIEKIYSVISGALTTGNATITADIEGTPVTNGVITIVQSGSAEDDVDVAAPTAAKTFAAGEVVTLTVGGTNDASRTANISMLVSPT